MLDSLKPDHWLFYVIDGLIYMLVFMLLVPTLRVSFRFLAKNQADESAGKAFIATILILLAAGAASAQPYAVYFGNYIVILYWILGAGVLRWVCWVSLKRGLLIMVIFGGVALGVTTAAMMLVNQHLPKDRVTLARMINKSMGRLDELEELAKKHAAEEAAQGPRKKMSMSNLLMRAKSGLRLEAESLVSAVALLKDPEQLTRLTSQHTEDLAALDLLGDGTTLTPEDMVDLGIVDEEAKKGVSFLESVGASTEITPQDVEDVAIFIRSIRKDGSEVTASDALVVILEARKRAAGKNPLEELVKLTSRNTADLAGLAPLLDGAKLSPDQLAGMGIVDEQAKMGMSVLEGIRATNDIGEQDVGKIMSLLKAVRKDDSEVTTNDALVVIREAMKRAGLTPSNKLFAIKTSGIASNAVSATSAVAKATAKVVIQQRSRKIDPLLALDAPQRAAWNRSQTGLVVSAVMAFSKGSAMAIVNGEMVHKGDIITVTSEGKSFKWQLAALSARGVIWEPIVGGTNQNDSTLVRWE